MPSPADGDVARNLEGDAAQAEYYRQELSGLRLQAQADLARKYVELQQLRLTGRVARATDVRRVIRALEYEITTLEQLGVGLDRWL